MHLRFATVILALAMCCFRAVAAGENAVAASAPGAAVAQRFIARHCAACHGQTKPRGAIRLDALAGEMARERETWENVRRVLLNKEMPPRERPQPAADEVQEVLRWLDASLQPTPKRTPPRRLNRFEFNNALNALLGIDEDFTPFLPEDAQVHGFDTDAQALAMTGPALAEYLRTAMLAVQYAMDDGSPGEAKRYPLVDVITVTCLGFDGHSECLIATRHLGC